MYHNLCNLVLSQTVLPQCNDPIRPINIYFIAGDNENLIPVCIIGIAQINNCVCWVFLMKFHRSPDAANTTINLNTYSIQ